MNVSPSEPSNKANIFFGLIEYELNSLRGAKYLLLSKNCFKILQLL